MGLAQISQPSTSVVDATFEVSAAGCQHQFPGPGEPYGATLWASAFLIVVQQIRFPIGQTAAWHAFATWAQNLGR
jgi:hypothetical protein